MAAKSFSICHLSFLDLLAATEAQFSNRLVDQRKSRKFEATIESPSRDFQ
jgi:hypothetical protein